MVKGALVIGELGELGQRIVRLLDEIGLRPTDALWLYRAESEDWILLLALPLVEKQGPKAAYEQIQSALIPNREQIAPISLADIGVVQPGDPLIQGLRKTFRIMPPTCPTRITNYRVNNSIVEEAVILRLRLG